MKMKRVLLGQMIAIAMVVLTACGGNTAQTTTTASTEESSVDAEDDKAEVSEQTAEAVSETQEADPMVETIDLSFDEGTLKYVGFEKANEGLTEAANALVFKFDFTNNQAKPAQSQSVFKIQFFQNGAELTNHASYSGKGGEQYELVYAYFSDAMKGGTVSFGMIVLPKDDSPITIMVSRNGGLADDQYQMMEVNISDNDVDYTAMEEAPVEEVEDAADQSGEAEETGTILSEEEIDELLQGEWELPDGGGTFYFEDGEMTVSSQGMILVGPYEVNLENTCIDAHFKSNDGQVSTIHLPYKFDDDGNLILMNNHGGEIKKK